jgi:hypothetical protein
MEGRVQDGETDLSPHPEIDNPVGKPSLIVSQLSNRLKTRTALCPPKPKELVMAALIFCSRA